VPVASCQVCPGQPNHIPSYCSSKNPPPPLHYVSCLTPRCVTSTFFYFLRPVFPFCLMLKFCGINCCACILAWPFSTECAVGLVESTDSYKDYKSVFGLVQGPSCRASPSLK
jgi:hypothetical protein